MISAVISFLDDLCFKVSSFRTTETTFMSLMPLFFHRCNRLNGCVSPDKLLTLCSRFWRWNQAFPFRLLEHFEMNCVFIFCLPCSRLEVRQCLYGHFHRLHGAAQTSQVSCRLMNDCIKLRLFLLRVLDPRGIWRVQSQGSLTGN